MQNYIKKSLGHPWSLLAFGSLIKRRLGNLTKWSQTEEYRHSGSLLLLSLGAEYSYLFNMLLELLESALIKPKCSQNTLTATWLAQLVEHQSAVREVEGLSPRPDEHSGS